MPGLVLGPETLSGVELTDNVTRQAWDRMNRLLVGDTQWLWEPLVGSGRAS